MAALLLACNKSGKNKASKYAPIEKASWLVGNWENNSQQGNLSETWTKENDSVLKGTAYFIKKTDTLHFEAITLYQNGEDVHYSTSVKGQHNDKPVAYKLTSATATKWVFENHAHDYPKKIVYNKVTDDSLVAQLSGMQQGKPSAENYPMKRVK